MGDSPKPVSPARVFARPTADQIWLGPPQQAALSQLSRPAQVRLLVGPSSCGKTTIAQYTAAHRYADAVVLQCRGAKDDATAVLTSLLLSADLAPWDLSEVEQRNLLTVFIQQRRSQGRRVLVLIDDANALKPAAVDELGRLAMYKLEKRPALELLIAGPPTAVQYWRALRDAGDVADFSVCELGLAATDHLVAYLEWRLARFEMQELASPAALQMIARLSGGRYGAADVLCQMSLLQLRQLNLERVDDGVVRQAMAALAVRQATKLEPERSRDEQPRRDVPPQGYLLISRGGRCLTKVPLGQRTLLGRSEHNDVCLPSPYLSRHHAVVVGTPDGYYLVDLNSVNGVALNGRRIERAALCDQDLLSIGPFRLKVQIAESLAQTGPFDEDESLIDTAVMPHQVAENSSLIRVK
jgi:type II secretory pathway predicted ATPase ExeA